MNLVHWEERGIVGYCYSATKFEKGSLCGFLVIMTAMFP